MRYFIGLIQKDADSDFGVSFPDFPGCVSAGETLDAAVAMGREALEGHVAVMAEGGEAIPEPTGMAEIMADPENRDGTPVLIPLAPTMAKTVRVNITMPAYTLSGIDAFAEQQGYTRSGFLVADARKAMERA